VSGKGGDGVTETTETPSAGPTGVAGKGNGKGAGSAAHGVSGKGGDGVTETTETPSEGPTEVAVNGKGNDNGADPAIPEESGKALGHTEPEQ
jgi:hypothetical protein